VHRDTLAQVLLDERRERGHETLESELGGLEAAAQGAGVEALWERLLLGSNLRGPEGVGPCGLSNAIRRDLGVCPDEGSVTIKLRPVALHKISIGQGSTWIYLRSRLAFHSWTRQRCGNPRHGDRGREPHISHRRYCRYSARQLYSQNAAIGSWCPRDRRTRPNHRFG
jgi:hypothetical protein